MTLGRNACREPAERIKRLLPVMLAAAGFVIGALVCAFWKGAFSSVPVPDMGSAFESASPFYDTVSVVSSELKYALLVYMLGFCAFGRAACMATAAYRSALYGWSAVYLLEAGYPLAVYFIHSAASFITLALLCCLCLVSSEYSDKFVRDGGRSDGGQIISYTVRCLFFAGLTVCVVIIRQILLLFT